MFRTLSTACVIGVAVAAGVGAGGCGRGDRATTTAVTGTVAYRERMALPPDAVVEIAIEDVSRADAPAEYLGQTRIEKPGQPPIAFSVPYDPRTIDARHRYVVRAKILVGGELWFTSESPPAVLTQGSGNRVDVMVQRVASGDGRKGAPSAPAPSSAPDAAAPVALTDLPASFVGDLPCADCSGIRYHLVLFPDHAFYLRLTALGRNGEAALDEIGMWSVSPDGGKLMLHGGRDVTQFAIADAKTLRKLDLQGRPVESKLPYELHRSDPVQVFEPRLAMRGMYKYMADAGVFKECLSGQRWPVAQEAANAALESAYSEAREKPGDEVLATVEGRVVQRPKMEGEGTQTVLVVESVVSVRPGQTCPPRPGGGGSVAGGPDGAPPLEGTTWALTMLGDRAPVIANEKLRPTMALDAAAGRVSGSGGCNQYFGTYALTGNGLRFAKLGATMMACPDMTLESAFHDALARVVSWRIEETHLELADEAGTVVMRFEARLGS
jgi:uncharacterized lipoprotein YbaY/heat shock protein HslJ/uncharacterized lipoprotein NlpE involved in copper resistance